MGDAASVLLRLKSPPEELRPLCKEAAVVEAPPRVLSPETGAGGAGENDPA